MVFTGLKSSTSCVISQECSMVLCLLAPFGKHQKNAQQLLATPVRNPPCERLCGGQACGLVREKPSGAKHRLFLTEKRRVSPPVRACVAGLGPRWGKRPVPARSGAIYASFRLSHQANGFPKTSSGERCVKQAGERPGVAGGVPCRVTSPGRAGR